jgi:large subunit ribosomal protein L3
MPLEGLLGRKLGMTQIFDENGQIHAVTVVEAGPVVVTQVKTASKDGYTAVQVAYGDKKRSNKPMRGHLKKLGDFRLLREFKGPATVVQRRRQGWHRAVQRGRPGRRDRRLARGGAVACGGNFHGGKTHGQSDCHRAPGSIGAARRRDACTRARRWPGTWARRR